MTRRDIKGEDMTNPADNPEWYACPKCGSSDGHDHVYKSEGMRRCITCMEESHFTDWKKPTQKEPDQPEPECIQEIPPKHTRTRKIVFDEVDEYLTTETDAGFRRVVMRMVERGCIDHEVEIHAQGAWREYTCNTVVNLLDDLRNFMFRIPNPAFKPAVEPEVGQIWESKACKRRCLILKADPKNYHATAIPWGYSNCETLGYSVLHEKWRYISTVNLSALEQSDE